MVAVVLVSACTRNTNLLDRIGVPDGSIAASCEPGGAQCNNCEDDDGDGLVDGFDPHCVSALDRREDSFDTGIPGDNNNTNFQDCFFDGNSGSGDDGCRIPTCCLTDPNGADCPPPGTPDFVTCAPDPVCVQSCAPKTPPGCDCFGCCTVCADGNCRDIVIHPKLAPNCDIPVLGDETQCPTCVKSACATVCDPNDCILCPGQTEEDLPVHCQESVCPDGLSKCVSNDQCEADQFCSFGCCIADIL
jgi:hypothetical protein